MSDITDMAALAILALMSLYLLALLATAVRDAAMFDRAAKAEQACLRSQVRAAVAAETFAREKAELSWSGFRKFTVRRKVKECGNIYSFYLAPHDGRPLPPFLPGQFLTFQLEIPRPGGERGKQSRPVIRCYSLSDQPRRDFYRITIKKIPPQWEGSELASGLSSSYFHDTVAEGDILDVKAPSGQFTLDLHSARPVVLIGGGIGITPVLSMLNTLVARGDPREIRMFLGVTDRTAHPMKDHLERIAAEHPNVTVTVCYSQPSKACAEGRDYHYRGWVTVDLLKKVLASNNYQFFFCGPSPMTTDLAAGLEEWGVPDEDIRYEAFGPASVRKVARAISDPAPAVTETTHKVVFARSGKTVDWMASDGALLDVAERNGVAIEFGCRAGSCGTCLTAVKSGEVSYDADIDVKPEGGSCLACVAQPKSKELVVDA